MTRGAEAETAGGAFAFLARSYGRSGVRHCGRRRVRHGSMLLGYGLELTLMLLRRV